MKSQNIYAALITLFLLTSLFLNAQSHQHSNQTKSDSKKDITRIENIVRLEPIDLKAIDKNKDGKVFQDEMDWNVISDKPRKCTLCKMTLQEVSLKQAKQNLVKNGYKTK